MSLSYTNFGVSVSLPVKAQIESQLSFTSGVILSRLLTLPAPQFSHLQMLLSARSYCSPDDRLINRELRCWGKE